MMVPLCEYSALIPPDLEPQLEPDLLASFKGWQNAGFEIVND